MPLPCTRCDSTGYLNIEQVPDEVIVEAESKDFHAVIRKLLAAGVAFSDVTVCDCCGDGDDWHGTPGEHYNAEDPRGPDGPYAYNGGLCECN